jgi:hypothetical protein
MEWARYSSSCNLIRTSIYLRFFVLQWILSRPERTIVLLCHWGVLNALTGEDFANCEIRTFSEKDLWVRRLSAF